MAEKGNSGPFDGEHDWTLISNEETQDEEVDWTLAQTEAEEDETDWTLAKQEGDQEEEVDWTLAKTDAEEGGRGLDIGLGFVDGNIRGGLNVNSTMANGITVALLNSPWILGIRVLSI